MDADLKSYFDTIPHDLLMARLREKIADNPLLALVESFLRQRVMDTMEGWVPEKGTPQGAVLSPLLSNIYLDPLDHLMASHHVQMVRYADDFVILCRAEGEAHRALALVQDWTTKAGLSLHPTKTRIVDATLRGGFDFLGYHFERGMRWHNAFFADHRLFFTLTAYRLACQSARRCTTNWRAVCGRSARTVRRGERPGNRLFLTLSGRYLWDLVSMSERVPVVPHHHAIFDARSFSL